MTSIFDDFPVPSSARPGRFTGKGRVVSLGKSIAFTEPELFDQTGALVARGSFTGRVMQGAMARRDTQ